MKRTLSFILAAALVISLMPAIAFAAVGDTFNVNFYDWTEYTGNNQYFSSTSAGTNWKVDSALSGAGQLAGAGGARVQVQNIETLAGFKFLTIPSGKGDLAINITAPKSGIYKMTVIAVPYGSNGKLTEVYVNGVKLNTFSSHGSKDDGWKLDLIETNPQELGTVFLKAGEYANTVVIKCPDGQAFLEGFTFEEVEPVPTAVNFNFYNELAVKPSNADPKDDKLTLAETTGAGFITIADESCSFNGDNRVYSAGGKAYPQFDMGAGSSTTWITSNNSKERKWTFKLPISAAGWYDIKFLGSHWFANDLFYLYVDDQFAGLYDFSGGITRAESEDIFLGDNKQMNTLYLTPDEDGYVKVMFAYAKSWGYGQARLAPIELTLTPLADQTKDVTCVDIVHTLPAEMGFGDTKEFEAYALMSDGTRYSFNGYTSSATVDANNGISVIGDSVSISRMSDPLFDEGLFKGAVTANAVGNQKITLTAMINGKAYTKEATINVSAPSEAVAFKLGLSGDDFIVNKTSGEYGKPADWTVSGASVVFDKTTTVESRRYGYNWGVFNQFYTASGYAAWPNLTTDSQMVQITLKKSVPCEGYYDIDFTSYLWNVCADYAIYINGDFAGNTNCYTVPDGWGTTATTRLNKLYLPSGDIEISFRARKSHYTGAMFFTPKDMVFTPSTVKEIAVAAVETSGIPEAMEAGASVSASAKAKMTDGEYRHFGLTNSGAEPTDDDVIKVTSSNPAVVAVTDVNCAKRITEAFNKVATNTIDPQTTTYKLNAIRAGTADITVTAIVDGVAKSTTKTVTVSGEAMEEAISKKTASVSILALTGGTVSTSLGNAVDNVEIGSEVEATATANDGYKFAYWKNSNGNVLSVNAKETFVINSNTSITAYFEKTVSASDTIVPVYFYNGNGEVLATENIEKGKTFADVTKPMEPTLTGYVFKNWSIANDAEITDVTRAVALYGESTATYAVTVIDGNKTSTQSGKAYGEEITVTASGNDFSYWMLGDDIVGYNKTLKIKVYGNMTLTAAYAGAKTAAPTVALDEVNGSYFLTYSVPAGFTKLEAGILFSKTGTPRVGASYSKAVERTGSGQFTAKPMGGDDNIARGYVMYTDGDEVFVIYAK